LVELYPTDDKTILHQRERYWIENNECVNKFIPTRTQKERNIDNHEQISKQMQIYYVNNADKIKEQSRIYRANNKDKIKEQMKEYQIKNRDKLKAYNKIRHAKKKIEKSLEPN
jgi:hypothetical protein